jgi:hypothetical protein
LKPPKKVELKIFNQIFKSKMGYVVLHLDKVSGGDATMSAHIERTIDPNNADKNRTHLNRELIMFPEGAKNRTEAIQHRIENAGITRKIDKNQVRAIRVMLSGTHEDMKQIETNGKLNEWCNDNLNWLSKNFGTENLVSAVLHLDKKTSHIHATVVPIVAGEQRKAKKEQSEAKKKYKKKPANAARLCADDIMARNKLKVSSTNQTNHALFYVDTRHDVSCRVTLPSGKSLFCNFPEDH